MEDYADLESRVTDLEQKDIPGEHDLSMLKQEAVDDATNYTDDEIKRLREEKVNLGPVAEAIRFGFDQLSKAHAEGCKAIAASVEMDSSVGDDIERGLDGLATTLEGELESLASAISERD